VEKEVERAVREVAEVAWGRCSEVLQAAFHRAISIWLRRWAHAFRPDSLQVMSVKLRLTRVGKTKQPHYRIVAADTRSARDGRFLEIVGNYHPQSEPSALTVDNAKALKWLKQGALPSERVKKLFEISGAWAEFMATKPAKPAKTAK